MTALRAELGRISDRFAERQPWPERWLVGVAGKSTLDQLEYASPATIVHAVVGRSVEGGVSVDVGAGVRVAAALQAKGVESLASPERNVVTFTPLVGVEAQPAFLAGPSLQARLLARGGFQQSTADFVPFEHCDTTDFAAKSTLCSAFVAQGGVVVTLFDRLRGQVVYEAIPTTQISPRPYA